MWSQSFIAHILTAKVLTSRGSTDNLLTLRYSRPREGRPHAALRSHHRSDPQRRTHRGAARREAAFHSTPPPAEELAPEPLCHEDRVCEDRAPVARNSQSPGPRGLHPRFGDRVRRLHGGERGVAGDPGRPRRRPLAAAVGGRRLSPPPRLAAPRRRLARRPLRRP